MRNGKRLTPLADFSRFPVKPCQSRLADDFQIIADQRILYCGFQNVCAVTPSLHFVWSGNKCVQNRTYCSPDSASRSASEGRFPSSLGSPPILLSELQR